MILVFNATSINILVISVAVSLIFNFHFINFSYKYESFHFKVDGKTDDLM
jgi:uncharacterized membrane protein YgaE (UPF0421/DUF939 family)